MTRWRTMHRRRRRSLCRQFTKDERIILQWLKDLDIKFSADIDQPVAGGKVTVKRIWMNDELVWADEKMQLSPDELYRLATHQVHPLDVPEEQRLTLATAIHPEDLP